MYGLGTDIIEVTRIESAIHAHGSRFLSRLFTESEQAYCLKHKDSTRRFAGRWAAKEAVAKAVGCGFGKDLSWLDIEILNEANGRPYISISPALENLLSAKSQLLISISHCENYATATALVLPSSS